MDNFMAVTLPYANQNSQLSIELHVAHPYTDTFQFPPSEVHYDLTSIPYGPPPLPLSYSLPSTYSTLPYPCVSYSTTPNHFTLFNLDQTIPYNDQDTHTDLMSAYHCGSSNGPVHYHTPRKSSSGSLFFSRQDQKPEAEKDEGAFMVLDQQADRRM
ncbi:hypothetical protein PM082_016848 [Marasmius tenuissimus]|nr:hypothetical protein PM082_016848 [Marasmius tenuissimus]